MRYLVTGAAGFIGSYIVNTLISKGHEVVCIDNESANNECFFWNKKAQNHKLSILNYQNIKPLFKKVDFVLHLAAESRITNAIKNPVGAYRTNIIGTENVLKLSLENGIKRFILSSTSSVYGLNPPPNKEKDSEDCLNPYSISKYTAEKICSYYKNNFNLPITILRYFNVFGERAPSNGYYAPVTSIFLRQKREKKQLTIVGDGSSLRDFIYVKDIVSANLKFCTSSQKKSYNDIFNVGSGENISILSLAKLISNDFKFTDPRIGEAKSTLASIKKIQNIINWKPKTSIKDWIKKQI